MEILKRIFGPLNERNGFSFNGICVVGTIRIDNDHPEGCWSKELYKFLEMNPDEPASGVADFLLSVVEEDRDLVTRFFNEKVDRIKNESHFLCKVQTRTGVVKRILGILKITCIHPERTVFSTTIFDISERAEIKTQDGNPDPVDLSTIWVSHICETKAAGVILLNKTGEFLKANQVYQQLSGHTEAELNMLTFLTLTPESDWASCTEKMGKLLSGTLDSVSFEKRMVTRSGELRWVEVHASPVQQGDTYILCFITDIHEKKQAEERLRISEERLHQAQSVAGIGSWSWDFSTEVVTWSRGMYDLLEVPYDYQPTPESAGRLIHPEDRDLFMEKVREGGEVKNLEVRLLTTRGVKHILVNSRLDYEEGVPVRYHGTCQDVTERWAANAKLQLIQKTAKLCWFETNLVTGESLWADSMYEMLGLDKNTITPGAESYFKTVHPDDLEPLMASWKNPETLKSGWHNIETRHVLPDGSIKYLLTSGNSVLDGDRPVKLIGSIMDISSAKEMQKKLEEAQEIARFGWWEIDLKTQKTTWSDFFYDILERDKSAGPLSFEEFIQHVHPDDRHLIYRDPKTLQDGWANQELRYLKKSGGLIYVLSSGNVVFNGDEPVKVLGTNMEITSLKETQLKLEQAQQIARLGWWEFDLTGAGNHWYSPEYMEIFGISKPEEINTIEDFQALVHPEDVQPTMAVFYQAFETGKWHDLVTRIRKIGGGYKYIRTNATIEYVNDQPVRLFGSVYDVSDFKEIEIQLERNLVNMEAMLSSMDNLVLIVDDHLTYTEAFCKDFSKLGFDPYELIGKKADIILAEQFRANELLRQYTNLEVSIQELLQMALEGETLEPIQYKLAPEEEIWWELRIKSFLGQDGNKWIVLVVNDITARKTAEEELIKSVQKEKELTEMRAEFVSMASHQFRTPLTVIKSNMQLLELAKVKDPVVDKVRHRLQAEVDRLVNLMEDVMTMGQVQSNTVVANFQPVKLSTLIKHVKLDIENQQEDKRLLRVTITGKEKPVTLDVRFMEQALHNLVDNAFKYSQNAPDPKIKLTYGHDKVRISVIDEGIGIPEKDRAALFTSFQRGSNSQHIRGTGLGLAVTKEFIRLNRGTIFLNSKRKDGTEFCIDIPYNDD